MAGGGAQRFQERARELGIAVEIHEFPAGTRTAADAARAIGCDVEQIVKSLVFHADDAPVLALVSGANQVDERVLARALGARHVHKADANQVREETGYAIGGTPPFGHDRELRVVCDRHLTTLARVWAAAGTPSSVFALDPATLLEVTGAAVIDVGGT